MIAIASYQNDKRRAGFLTHSVQPFVETLGNLVICHTSSILTGLISDSRRMLQAYLGFDISCVLHARGYGDLIAMNTLFVWSLKLTRHSCHLYSISRIHLLGL